MRLVRFLTRRVLLLALVLAAVSVLIFGVIQVLPGDVAVMILGTSSTPEDLAALREQPGSRRARAPLRYVDWVTGAVRGDWGTSLLYKVPVRPLVLERLRHSALLAGLALVVAVPLSIALGVLSAVRRARVVDQATSLVTLVAVSLPEFVWGTVLILTLAYWWPLFPPSSMVDPRAGFARIAPALILPVLTLVLGAARPHDPHGARQHDRGAGPALRPGRPPARPPAARVVILRHALRNALLPTVGIVAINIGYLIGGIFVVETCSPIPGWGGSWWTR